MTNANGSSKLTAVLLSVLTAGWLGMMGWMMVSITELQQFAARGDRFTTQDWVRNRQELIAEIDKRFPPKWLIDRLEMMVASQERLVEEQRRLQLQIDRLEGHRPRTYTSDE